MSGTRLGDAAPWGGGTFGDALLAPTVLYVRPVLKLMQQLPVKVLFLAGPLASPSYEVALPSRILAVVLQTPVHGNAECQRP